MDASGCPVRLEATDEGLDHARPGAPGDVETGHRVAMSLVATVTALGPAHDREEAEPHRSQPGTFLPRSELQVGLRPAARPVVLGPLEAGRSQPVLAGQIQAVAHPQPALPRGAIGRAACREGGWVRVEEW